MSGQFYSHQEKSQTKYLEERVKKLPKNSSVDTVIYEDVRDPHYLPPGTDLPAPTKYLQLKDAIAFVADLEGDQLPASHWDKIGWIRISTCIGTSVILRPNGYNLQ